MTMKMYRKTLLKSTILAALSLAPLQTYAQESEEKTGIKEIVVTAQKRGENLQDVPIAISAISSEQMASQGINSIQGVVAATPSLYQAAYPTANTALFLFMRGMGVGDPMQVTKDSSIGIYQNGIYNARPQALAFDLADVERLEVLRGPQGTLYGRNTTGGAINIISRAPTGEAGLRQTASYGSRNQYRSVTHVDLPELGGIALKGTLAMGGDDGWGKNRPSANVPNTNDFNSQSYIAGRIAAQWRPSTEFTADYSFEVGKVKSTPMLLESPDLNGLTIYPGIVYQAERDRAYRSAELPESVTNIRDHGLTLNWDVSSDLTIRSTTGIRYFDTTTYSDTMEVYFIPLVSENELTSKQFSQELQLIGQAFDDRLKYAIGAYYFREKANHLTANTFALVSKNDNYINAKSTSKAIYAQLTYTPPLFNDNLDITVGGRYTVDNREATRNQFADGVQYETDTSNDMKFKKFTPSVTLNYNWTEDVSTYAKLATGYRAGGSTESGPDFSRTFSPENLTSYELGFKSMLLDRRLRLNISAFYNKYTDMQLDVSPDPSNVTISETRNAGDATIKGVEVDVTAAVTPALNLSFSYALLDHQVKTVRIDGGPNIAGLFIIPYAPEHSLNISFDWTVLQFSDGHLKVNGDYSYKSRVYNAGAGPDVVNRDFYSIAGFSTVNGRVTLQKDMNGNPVDLSLWVKNLLNDRYAVYASATGSYLTGYNTRSYSMNAPRSIGAEISFSF